MKRHAWLAIGLGIAGAASADAADERFRVIYSHGYFFDVAPDDKDLGKPIVEQDVYLIEVATGQLIECEGDLSVKDGKWVGKPMRCHRIESAQTFDTNDAYTYRLGTTKPDQDRALSFFRIDQTAATISFCVIAGRASCTPDAPLLP